MSALEDPDVRAAAASLRSLRRPRPAERVQKRLEELARRGLEIGLDERLAAEVVAEELAAAGKLDDTAALDGALMAILCRKPSDYAVFEGLSADDPFTPGSRLVGRTETFGGQSSVSRGGPPWRREWRRWATWIGAAALTGLSIWAVYHYRADLRAWWEQISASETGSGPVIVDPGPRPGQDDASEGSEGGSTAPQAAATAGPAQTISALLNAAAPYGFAPTLSELVQGLPTPPGARPETFAQALHELTGAPRGIPLDLSAPDGWLPRLAQARDIMAGETTSPAAAYVAAAREAVDALPAFERDPDRQRAIDAPQRIHEIDNPPWLASSSAQPVTLAQKLGVALTPLALVLAWLAVQVSRRAFLRRRRPAFPPEETEHVAGVLRKAQPGWSRHDKRLAQLLQAREPIETRRLDLEATVEATARAGLWPSVLVQYQALRPAPEYLVLLEAEGAGDLDAERMRALVAWLETQQLVNLDIYRFQFSVAWLRPEGGGPAEPIEAVYAKHPNHRLIILGRGDGLVDISAKTPRPAARTLLQWTRRALLTPVRIGDWGAREQALARALAMPIGRATRDGALLLGDMLGLEGPETSAAERERLVTAGDGRLGPLPETLRITPERVLHRRQPRDFDRAQLIAELREAVDGVGLDWLAALAVYPELRWDLTLYLGVKLKHYADTPAGDRRLAMLTRLPWLRAGQMPDWVRETLIDTLSKPKRGQVYQVIDDIIAGAETLDNRDEAAVRLRIAEEKTRPAPPPPELVDEEIGQDRVLLEFLRRGDKGDYPVRARRRGGVSAAVRDGGVQRALAVAVALGGGAWAVSPAVGAVAVTGAWLPAAALYGGAVLAMAVSRLLGRAASPRERSRPVLREAAAPMPSPKEASAGLSGTSSVDQGQPGIAEGKPVDRRAGSKGEEGAVPQILSGPRSPKVYIIYRHADRVATDWIAPTIREHLGQDVVVSDLEVHVRDQLQERLFRALDAADLVIVVIGREWRQRIVSSNESDLVWIEIGRALSSGKRIIPVLVDGAVMPSSDELPNRLRRLSGFQAITLRREEPQRLLNAIGFAGTIFRDALRSGGEGPEMVVIPAGRFLMGSPDSEPGRTSAEDPQHEVTFAGPFALGRYAVTFDEYDAFCAATGREKPSDKGWGRGRRPAINVSCKDAESYCAWLSEQTGAAYRLPSEAEWEYACRAGTSTPFWWGSSITPDLANYDGNYVYAGGGAKGVYRKKTEPVDAFKPNPWGLYQMHGNVWEWCADAWNDAYKDAPSDGSAWRSGDTSLAVLRGGSWSGYPGWLRSAYRLRLPRNSRPDDIGFRVARTHME